jgi:hypothetical protein
LSPLKDIPEIPQLPDEIALETKHEFMFTEWPKVLTFSNFSNIQRLPSPSFRLLPEDSDSDDDLLGRFKKSLTEGHKLIKSDKVMIRYAHSPPATICHYLYQLIAYETEDKQLSKFAYNTLEHYFTSQKVFMIYK